MKHFTLIAAAAIAATSIQPATAARFAHASVAADKPASILVDNTAKQTRALRAPSRNEAKAIWCPITQNVFGWDLDEEQWILEETYTTEYNTAGKRLVDTVEDKIDEGTVRTSYEYDEFGNIIAESTGSLTEDGEFQESSRKKTTYGDPKLPNAVTENRQWVLVNNELKMAGNNYNRIITRNEAGNITKIEIETYYNEQFETSRRVEISYGADGKASEIKCSELTIDYFTGQTSWVDGEHYTDIVWENTDGQIFDGSSLFYGANRIKSAHYTNDSADYDLTVVYNGKDYVATSVGLIQGFDAKRIATVKFPDEYGSEYNLEEYFSEEDGEEIYEAYLIHVLYNEWGYITLDQYVNMTDPDNPEIWGNQTGSCECDPEHGYPLSYTLQAYDEDLEEMVNRIRIEFSDYIDASAGVENVATDANTSAPVYYNLQGLPVSNPAKGIYIQVAGGKASKVAL